jgi:hypothetical protein
MADFIAALAPDLASNWEVCKRERLWGIGQGKNWSANAARVAKGDHVYIWRSRSGRRPGGFIAYIEALDRVRLASEPGVRIPWPDPKRFGGVLPMRVVAELDQPAGDRFPKANGYRGERFGFPQIALRNGIDTLEPDCAQRIVAAFPLALEPPTVGRRHVRRPHTPPSKPTNFEPADPDSVGRGWLAHHQTLEALADSLESHGVEPLDPQPDEPEYDLAWLDSGVLHVAEVKSITSENEIHQLRLGLGQVLDYRLRLRGRHRRQVRAWLVPERQPNGAGHWTALCAEHGVDLRWPGTWV